MPERVLAARADMSPAERLQRLEQLRRRLRFLKERLKDVTDDPALSAKRRREKKTYYTNAIAEARTRLLELENTVRSSTGSVGRGHGSLRPRASVWRVARASDCTPRGWHLPVT